MDFLTEWQERKNTERRQMHSAENLEYHIWNDFHKFNFPKQIQLDPWKEMLSILTVVLTFFQQSNLDLTELATLQHV